MRLIHASASLREACDALRAEGSRIGFVPTMGALHPGHMSLCAAARARGAQRIVVSIFVNPMQFGPSEDFGKYPRTLEADLELCRTHGVDLVYAPDPQAMYGAGFQSHVEVEQLTRGFEGAMRPTHFRGVTTVVAKLFNAVGPCVAAFGRKDYQQWRVIERMARDLDMPVEVLGCPILRESDGLAMSSRNRYLDPDQRQRATAISTGLKAADAAYRAGVRDVHRLRELVHEPIAASFDSIDYVELADALTLEPIAAQTDIAPPRSGGAMPPSSAAGSGGMVVLVAARLGATRLIDNAILGEDPLG